MYRHDNGERAMHQLAVIHIEVPPVGRLLDDARNRPKPLGCRAALRRAFRHERGRQNHCSPAATLSIHMESMSWHAGPAAGCHGPPRSPRADGGSGAPALPDSRHARSQRGCLGAATPSVLQADPADRTITINGTASS